MFVLRKSFYEKIAPLNLLCQMSFEDLKEMPCLTQIPLFYQQVLLGHCKSTTQPQLFWGNHLINCDILNINGSYKQNIFQRLVVKSQYFTDMSKIKHALKKI